jgi:DNA topoisomerase-1
MRSQARTVRHLSRRLQRLLAAERPPLTPAPADPEEAAALARLRYVGDDEPGISRRPQGKGVSYVDARGKPVRDRRTLARIRALAIPPAWTDVWICPDADGHIQAVGRDAAGRKQYRYHARWREVRDRTKFGRMIAFAQALPRIRRAVDADLDRPGLPVEKVLATLVSLLERTCMRVGNDEYARDHGHFGLTTLLNRHATIAGGAVKFHFKGKGGKEHAVGVRDARLARIVRRCQEIPGQRLFQYVDESGERHAVDSGDVNAYLRRASGSDFTAKDFRTWAGTVFVAEALLAAEEPRSVRAGNAQVLAAIDRAADRLGNTRAVCRTSYVHPAVMDAFMEGRIAVPAKARPPRGLDATEAATLRILRAAAGRPVARAR